MSVSSEQALVQYTQTSPAQVFAIPFYFINNADVTVVMTRAGVDTTLAIITNYTQTGAGTNPAAGNITMVAGLANDIVTIYRSCALTQTYNFTSNGPFPSLTMTQKVDYLTMLAQQLKLSIARCLQVPVSNAAIVPMTLAARANGIVGFDVNGVLTYSNLAAFTASVQALVTQAQTSATAALASQTAALASQNAASASATAAAASASAAAAQTLILTTYAQVRAVVTAGIAGLLNSARYVSISGDYEVWRFVAGTNADDGVSWLRPNDYNAVSNAFVYQRIN